ncbi:helix-turn-helix domain-containing protein [Streptomyces sp. NPDC040750]|uniref:helix-turn-helix domain-containing protein n=1 Tax=Streptomyces sp. NPDC040750 TaxID=3154491 RepID=UPI0033D6301D
MTIKHIAMVLEAEGLDGPEKLLLIAYCNRTDDHGYCWPGQQRLAADCGTSPATVKRVKKKLIEKKLIASQRRLDPKTGEPITNLTRVNLELLAAMKRKPTAYDDNVIERITFGADAPLPQKKRKAPKGTGESVDQVMAHNEPSAVDDQVAPSGLLRARVEPNHQLKVSPTPGQGEPNLRLKLSPRSGQAEPLNISNPPQNHRRTVLPSVGSTDAPTTDRKKPSRQQIPLTEGVRFLQALGNVHPKLMLTGKTLQDQGLVVSELFRRGWKDEVLWELLTRPLPQPLRKTTAAVLAARLSDALASPMPSRWRRENETPVPRQYTEGTNTVIRRHYECEGRNGLCGLPVEAEGALCVSCARVAQQR